MPHAALILVFCLFPLMAQGQDATPHRVEPNGHSLTVWEKTPAKPPMKANTAEAAASKLVTPTLLINGQFDPLTPMNQQAEFFAKLGTADKWFIELSGGDHAALLETPRNRMLLAIDSFIRYLDE